MGSLPRPSSRNDFHVAIICALPCEVDAVVLLFDRNWDEEGVDYSRAEGDWNHYTTGRIGGHDVVLAHLPSIGTKNAAAAAASLRFSYVELRLTIIVGICGGMPKIDGVDVFLGDVVISRSIVQYDYGKQYPGHFDMKSSIEDSLGRANKDIRGLLALFDAEHERKRLRRRAADHLKQLQNAAASSGSQVGRRRGANYLNPGPSKDRLFKPDYIHRHHTGCRRCHTGHCEIASKASCRELGCEKVELVSRNRYDGDGSPEVFVGRIGSGNTVMKSGEDRDRIAAEHNLIAFEMEGAGVWEEVPCVVVKGICDYADSHKNKRWQNYAAATAACMMKAMLQRHVVSDRATRAVQSPPMEDTSAPCHVIPYIRNLDVVNRRELVEKLNAILSPTSPYAVAALWGLGGSGKTQIALQYAYQRWEARDSSVFWVHADTEATFMHDYKDIARKLNLNTALDGEPLLVAVREKIESLSSWVLIIDNADDITLFSSEQINLRRHIPRSARKSGTLIWTSRDEKVVGTLVGPGRGIEVTGMRKSEARALLSSIANIRTVEEDGQVDADVQTLLEELKWLALPISQAGAFMRRTSTSAGEYLALLSDERQRVKLLQSNESSWDQGFRRSDVPNSVLDTWRISIERIRRENGLAYHILHVISYVDNQRISHLMIEEAAKYYGKRANRDQKSLSHFWKQRHLIDDDVPDSPSIEVLTAISRLKEYSFIQMHREREGKRSYEIHKLVQDAARYGLYANLLVGAQSHRQQADSEAYFSGVALQVISKLYPWTERNAWQQAEKYLAHALRVVEWVDVYRIPNCASSLIDRLSQFMLGRGDNAERNRLNLVKKAYEIRREALGELHPDTLLSMFDTASSHYNLRSFAAAEDLAHQLYPLRRRVLGKTHPDTIQTLSLKADAVFAQGDTNEAEYLLARATQHCREAGVDNTTAFAQLLFRRAKMRYGQGDYDSSLDLALSAIDIFQQHQRHSTSEYYIWCTRLVAEIHTKNKNYPAAAVELQRALALSQELLGMTTTTIHIMELLAFAHYKLGQYGSAEPLARQVVHELKAMYGEDYPGADESMDLLARIDNNRRRAYRARGR